ncbi:type II toxin-antitoxin system VapB family antitoxin [Rhizobium sp. CFBP 8762]|uniref:type II toxin-antitoxin system VapB family antitoxin n=1 Tax=Rhizobium sp. CFBP 8762 TaxID=2775279 RepID=UPI00177ABD4B|nr:type II toxin-antitoxin system VapB family antitoxin [Rhizobium sp. CFBP 8762]MBD8555111.1 type II toxin-antitoxin system VapB family antitoxin [Rhizobium sp. CFBP 8762]
MVINVKNKTADRLTREFATPANVSLTDAIIIAMREAIGRRPTAETHIQTAARIREKYNLKLSDEAKNPLPKEVFDKMWEA